MKLARHDFTETRIPEPLKLRFYCIINLQLNMRKYTFSTWNKTQTILFKQPSNIYFTDTFTRSLFQLPLSVLRLQSATAYCSHRPAARQVHIARLTFGYHLKKTDRWKYDNGLQDHSIPVNLVVIPYPQYLQGSKGKYTLAAYLFTAFFILFPAFFITALKALKSYNDT